MVFLVKRLLDFFCYNIERNTGKCSRRETEFPTLMDLMGVIEPSSDTFVSLAFFSPPPPRD